jgi:beta-aspartyl-dipeptidase (metallo-type)
VVLIVDGGDVFTPSRLGAASVLALNGAIASIGTVDSSAFARLDVAVDVLDASDGFVLPGFIDPHVHIIGGSGERSYSTWTPEIFSRELIGAGVTTVVGCLGVDTTMKNMATLVGKAKGLKEDGVTAFVYSGGYDVPPSTLMRTVREDMLFVTEVIGAGEIAIADRRSTQPSTGELARIVADASVGGLLSGKAGVTHFHVGDGSIGLKQLRELLEGHDVRPECLYASHVERTPSLLVEAADLSRRGAFVDVDTVEGDLADVLNAFVRAEGEMRHLTVSSDASITPPRRRFDQWRLCAAQPQWPLERLLPLVTTNVASVLKLGRKGRLERGADADLLVLERTTLEPRHVVAGGRVLMRDGVITAPERFLDGNQRKVHFDGSAA